MKKTISEDLSFDITVKYGVAMEQGAQKVEQISSHMSGKEEDCVPALEEQARPLKGKNRLGRRISCRTWTWPINEQEKCPGKNVIYFSCAQTGHCEVSKATVQEQVFYWWNINIPNLLKNAEESEDYEDVWYDIKSLFYEYSG